MNTQYLVCQYKQNSPDEICGIFSTVEKADEACRDENYYYMALELDQPAPHESTPIDVTYPRRGVTLRWDGAK